MSPKYEIGAPYGGAEGSLTPTPTGTLASFFGFLERSVAEVLRYRALRVAEKELHALDDRMLKDIGIDRSEIKSALSGAAQQRSNYWRT